jgi:hypothetical protein
MGKRFKVLCTGQSFGKEKPFAVIAAEFAILMAGGDPHGADSHLLDKVWHDEFMKHIKEFPDTNQPGGKTLKDLGLI